MNILLVFKWNKQPCCQTLTRNQHFTLLRPEINVFELTRCMKWLYSFFKWNQHPCCQTLKNFNFHFFFFKIEWWTSKQNFRFIFYFWKTEKWIRYIFIFIFFFKNLKKETAQSSFSFFTKKLKMNFEKWVEKFVLIFNRNEKWKWTKF